MPIAISDSSTLIHLARIGRLSLLQRFFDTVLIPPAVRREVVEEGRGRVGADEVAQAIATGWITVIVPTDRALVRLLKRDLHDGEAEAIALASEQQEATVLLDESDARQRAEALGQALTGVIGLLIRAKLEGHTISLREELDRLRQDAGFWISDGLYRQALLAVDESPG